MRTSPGTRTGRPRRRGPTGVPTSSLPLPRTGSRGAAVRTWQNDIDRVAGKIAGVHQIAQDGIVGPRTRAAMDTALHGSSAG